MLNFANFKAVKTANTKTSASRPKGQKFSFKFKKFISKKGGVEKVETVFTIADAKFEELNLSNVGLMQITSPDGVPYLATVDNDNATVLKRTAKLAADAEKGRKFKSSILENALIGQGTIQEDSYKAQLLELSLVGQDTEVNGILCHGIYAISSVETTADNEETDEDTAEDEDVAVEETADVQEADDDNF